MDRIKLFDLPAQQTDSGKVTPFVVVHDASDDDARQRISAGLRAFREQTGASVLVVSPSVAEAPGLTPDHIAVVNTLDGNSPVYLTVVPEFDADTNPGVKAVAQMRQALVEALNRADDEDED